MSDITKQLFHELESTYSLVNEPTNLQFLEIDPNIVSTEEIGFDRTGRLLAYKQLKNAVGSIHDIENSRHGLSFVGVLGHFTSGKSSLINALLGIGRDETPGYKRKVGPHPTDKTITLICHQDAREALEKNAITSINDVEIVHGPPLPFLSNIVLVDTPGLGNAEAEHDLAERFLHLCHVIIITVDGMVPFADTSKDFDLLDKAINRLSGVPKIFAVTKSMTFLTHRQGEYETDWDHEKAKTFWIEALNRIVADSRFSAMKGELESMPVCFVDSIDHHNIEELKELFSPITKDQSQLDRIFQAKVDYVVDVTKESINVFDKHLKHRLTNLNTLYKEAHKRAAAAENSISSQLIAVQNAIQTATQKLVNQEKKIAEHKNVWGVPLPDKELLFDRYQSFEKQVAVLQKKSVHMERDCVSRIRDELYSRIDWVYGLKSPALVGIGSGILPAIASENPQNLDDKEFALTIEELDYYSRSSAKRIAERIRDKQSTELFFLRYDGDKTVLTEVQQSIAGGLGQFVRVYNGAATQFVAYLTQPSAKVLLAEYGLILFGDNEDLEIKAAKLEVDDFPAWCQIGQTVEQAKKDIDLAAKVISDLREQTQSFEDFDPSVGPFDNDFNLAKMCWGAVRDQRLEPAVAALSASIQPLLEENIDKQKERRKTLFAEIADIWLARLELLIRTCVVGVLPFALLFGLRNFDIDLYTTVTNAVMSDWKNIVYGVIGTMIVAFFSRVVIGPKNSRLKKPFSTEFRPIMKYFCQTREAKKLLRQRSDQFLVELESQLARKPLDLENKVHQIVGEWFKNSEICKPLKETGDRIQELHTERRNSFSAIKSTMLAQMSSLKSEGSTIANKKREESVERVLTIVTDKRDLIIGLRENLANRLKNLTDPATQ